MPERDDSEIADQLRAYVDGVSTPVGPERARVLAERHVARRRRMFTGVIEVVAVAAVVATIAVAATSNRSSHPAAPSTVSVPRTTTSLLGPTSTTTATVPVTTPTTPATTPPPATGTWDQIVTGPDGVFAFSRVRHQLGRIDEHGRLAASATVRFDDLRLDTDGFLFGTAHQGGGTDLLEQIDARTFRLVTSGHLPTGLLTGHGNRLWIATAHVLQGALIGGGSGGTNEPSITVPGAPMADLAIDPSGERLYVAQFDERQQLLVSVRSAVDGHLLVAPKVVGSGPGPGHIVAAANGVWVAQPTGMMGNVQRWSPEIAAQGVSTEGSNSITVVVGGNVVLVDRAATDGAVLCLDPVTGSERGRIPNSLTFEPFATDGVRIYQAPFAGGIEVRDLPPACRG